MNIQYLFEQFQQRPTDSNFLKLYKRVDPGLRIYVKGMINSYKFIDSYEMTNDIMSDVYYKVIVKINKYNSLWNFSTWIYAITYYHVLQTINRAKKHFEFHFNDGYPNACRDHRNPYRFKEYSDDCFDIDVFETANFSGDMRNYYYDSTTTLNCCELEEQECFKETLYSKVMGEFDNLPPRYKEIMIDREINNMKYEDIAEKHQLPLQTIKNRIRLGRIRIKEKVNDFLIANNQ